LVTFFSLGPARIDDGATVDIPNQGASASGFQVGDNASLSGELTGDVELQNGILMSSSVAGVVTGHGVVVGAGPTIAFPNGPVSLTRDLAVGGAAEIYSTLPAHLGPRTTIVGGTLVADNGVLLGANDELRGSGAVEASITGAAASFLHADGGDLEVGDATAAAGFQTDGAIVVDVAGRLVINSASRARLGGETVVDGILAAAGGVAISAGGTLSGSGTVDAPVAGESGSTIRPSGNLALGASAADGFAFAGMLEVGGNNVRLFDADQSVLGALTTIDAGGTLRADNGVVVDFGRTITGAGVVNSLDNAQQATIINGLAAGASAGQPLTFEGYVKGVGTFSDVVFNGTFAPGLSPAMVETGSLAFGAESVLEIELGGMTPGAEYDQLLVEGNLQLDGTLQISLLNGFQPEAGAQFEILTYESLSGDFDRVEFVGPWRGAVAFGDSAALLTILAVPEPGTAVLGALAILTAIGRCSYRRIWLASTRQAAGGRIAN
jgi:hypothetical protein